MLAINGQTGKIRAERRAATNSNSVFTEVTCAAEVFIASALLHREQPGREDFTIQEIVNRAAKENVAGELRSGVSVHASQHCVANRPPNPGKHRMLFATSKHTRRLLLLSDAVHPGRTGKTFPDADEIPDKYLPLLGWAKRRFAQSAGMAATVPFSASGNSGNRKASRKGDGLNLSSSWKGLVKITGKMWTPTNSCGSCARVGNEPGLFGHQLLHLSD